MTISPRTSAQAVASLILGVLSLGLLAVTGLPALYLGYRGLYTINVSEGRLRGRRLAVAGMALGGLGVAASILWLGIVGLAHLWERSDRSHCTDNLRRVGKALARYADAHGSTYPMAALPLEGLPPRDRLSWLAALLPYLDLESPRGERWQVLHARLDLGRGWQAPVNRGVIQERVSPYLCPSLPPERLEARPALTSYVGMAGVDPDAASLPAEHPRAGFFGYERLLHPGDLRPGTGYVLIGLETAEDLGPWAAGGPATARGLDPDATRYLGALAPFGGLHEGGLNTLWADGSVHFLTDSTPPELVRQLVQINRDPGPPDGH